MFGVIERIVFSCYFFFRPAGRAIKIFLSLSFCRWRLGYLRKLLYKIGDGVEGKEEGLEKKKHTHKRRSGDFDKLPIPRMAFPRKIY